MCGLCSSTCGLFLPTRVIRGVRLRFGISTPSSVILTIGLFPSGTSFSPPSSLCAFLLFSSPFTWSSFGSLWRFDGVCPPSGSSTLRFSCRNVWFLTCWVHCDAFASIFSFIYWCFFFLCFSFFLWVLTCYGICSVDSFSAIISFFRLCS